MASLRTSSRELTDREHELHLLLRSRSKLKSSMRTSALLAGFALVAMVEVEIDNRPPTALLIPFATNTAVLTFVHLFSLMIATRLLPELDAVTVDNSNSQPYITTMAAKLAKSWPVQMCWFLSNIVGIVLFIIEVILVAYVKFYPGREDIDQKQLQVGTATLVVVVLLSILAVPFIIVFFRSVSKQKLLVHEQRLTRARVLLESMNQAKSSAAAADDGTSGQNTNSDLSSLDSYHTGGSYEQPQKLPVDTQV